MGGQLVENGDPGRLEERPPAEHPQVRVWEDVVGATAVVSLAEPVGDPARVPLPHSGPGRQVHRRLRRRVRGRWHQGTEDSAAGAQGERVRGALGAHGAKRVPGPAADLEPAPPRAGAGRQCGAVQHCPTPSGINLCALAADGEPAPASLAQIGRIDRVDVLGGLSTSTATRPEGTPLSICATPGPTDRCQQPTIRSPDSKSAGHAPRLWPVWLAPLAVAAALAVAGGIYWLLGRQAPLVETHDARGHVQFTVDALDLVKRRSTRLGSSG